MAGSQAVVQAQVNALDREVHIQGVFKVHKHSRSSGTVKGTNMVTHSGTGMGRGIGTRSIGGAQP